MIQYTGCSLGTIKNQKIITRHRKNSILAPAVLAQPGALEVVSVSQSVSQSVRSKFLVAEQLYNHRCLSVCNTFFVLSKRPSS